MKCDKANFDSLDKTVECLKKGGVVILPTDTVYGFSGIVDLKSNEKSFKTDYKIRAIKGRSETKPLIQLIAKPEDLYIYTDDIIPESIMEKWPGALTIIVNCRKTNPLKYEMSTVAFRCPGDKWLRDVIEAIKAPVYSTSVNRSGLSVIDEVKNIEEEFGKEVDLIVDDGDKKGALPSTLITIKDGKAVVLRQGSVEI